MIKKIIYVLVFFAVLLFSCDVNAATYSDKFDEHGAWISNEFISKTKNGSTKYQQMTKIVRKSDNRFVYCIEPGKPLYENNIITGYDTDQANHASLTNSQWDRINLLAYYGYGYGNHTDIKWYVITQFMIWHTNNLGYDIYFTDTLNGKRITKYTDEMQELDNLVNSQFIVPFGSLNVNMFWGEEKIIEDKNGVLEKYEIRNGPNINTTKNGNSLTIKSNNYGSSYVTMIKSNKRFNNKPVVYIDSLNQDLLLPGDLSDITNRIEIKMNYGNLELSKLDCDTKNNAPNHEGVLSNALYGLYDLNNNLLESNYTNRDGKTNFSYKLSEGKYYIKEISPSIGYNLDETKYYFDINKNNYNVKLNVYEDAITENFEIIKILNNNKTGKVEFEENIEFGIYDKDNKLVKRYITDNFGTIKFTLDFGEYTIKQLTSYDIYEKIEDFKVSVKENNKNNKIVLQDNKIIYKVQLNVKEKNTNNNIKNITFELYDKNNKIICNKNKCLYKTDADGNILFLNDFEFEPYKIKLVIDDNFQYIYLLDAIDFKLDKNTVYKQLEGYRLVELKYYLELKKQSEIIKPIIKEDIEIVNPIEKEENIMNDKFEIQDIHVEENKVVEQEKLSQKEILVKLPNTYKSDCNIYFIMITTFIIAIKNYFKK